MNRRNLDNKRLDTIGRRLIESDRVQSANIDKIVANPDLFALVSARIAASGKTPSLSRSRAMLFVRRNAVAFAGVAMMIAAAIGIASFLRSEKPLFTAKDVQVPGAVPVAARPEVPPKPMFSKSSPGRASNLEDQPARSDPIPVSKQVERKPANAVKRSSGGDFYALSFGDDQDDTVAGGRIVRVDVPRSSLLALGANVPLENDSEVVKADLLIGSDGVARGIRIVK